MLISLLTLLRKIPKLPRVGVFECQLRMPKSGVCLDQNLVFVDRGEEGGLGFE